MSCATATLYKNNSGLIAKTKVNKYKKGLCLTEKLVRENPLLFIYKTEKLMSNFNLKVPAKIMLTLLIAMGVLVFIYALLKIIL